MDINKKETTLGLLRISLGLIFIWAFFDKFLGLGFATASNKSWLFGTSPTLGFLKFGTNGPFASIFQAIAGNVFVDWLFMLGLLLVGMGLIFGICTRISTYSGSFMLFFMWLAVLPPEHHPFLDEHIIYTLSLFVLLYSRANEHLGLGKQWGQLELVKRYPILK